MRGPVNGAAAWLEQDQMVPREGLQAVTCHGGRRTQECFREIQERCGLCCTVTDLFIDQCPATVTSLAAEVSRPAAGRTRTLTSPEAVFYCYHVSVCFLFIFIFF